MRKLAVFFLPLFVIGATVIACSSDDTTTPATATTDAGTDTGSSNTTPDTGSETPVDAGSDAPVEAAATTGQIDVTTTYTGNKTGTLMMALFTSTAPGVPPVDYASIPAATFPNHYSFKLVPPGTYYLYAYVDITNTGAQQPTASDPQVQDYVTAVVAAGQTVASAATLTVPNAH